ncbi:MAG TPA: ABC transporter ATP-binding protein [Streptosporangiaceae bacterium]|jgi:ABC-2 type transport system ATP-binding protein|nr:ABC transporter ATP-binding protein [Streptosporangiaceae bacterium]
MNVSSALGAHYVAVAAVGTNIGPGLLVLVVLLIAAGGYGVTRLRRGRREGRIADSTWRPERPGPAPTGAQAQPAHFAEPASLGQAQAVAPRPASSVGLLEAPAAGWAVETHGLTKRFGANVAVDNVELLVPRGSAFGYLGPNGAGKTTLIRTLLGLTRADAGTMSLLGIGVPAQRSRALARVGAIVDEPRFHHHLTGRENLRLLSAARGGDAATRIPDSLARVGLTERADDKVASYSMGMRQRLGVAACLLGDPELLILDEPMNGLDPAGMHEMRAMVRSLVDEGRTVVLSSHLLDEVERTCDAVAIVDRGRIIRQGPIDELVRSAGARVVQLDCSDPAEAARLLEQSGITTGVAPGGLTLTVTLPSGASRETVAEVNRRVVERGISVYGLQEVHATLEDWFLSVTSRLGEHS